MADACGVLSEARVVAGTTNGCASFLAPGAREIGDGVSAPATTLTIKQLAQTPIFALGYGVYSKKVLGLWLVEGASNSGGGARLAHFNHGQDRGADATAAAPTR